MVSIGATFSFILRVMSYPNIYSSYIRLLRNFKSGKLDGPTTASELQTLFKGYDDLLYGCRMFLPPQCCVPLPFQPQEFRKNNVVPDMDKLNFCINFQNKFEKQFADNQGVICAYLKIIKALTKSKLSNNEAYDTVAKIFGDENQDLVDEFKSVLKSKKRKKEEENLSSPSSSNSSEEIKAKRQKTGEERNIYMRMEDEMFEIDVQLSRMRTTVESAKSLLKKLEDSTQQHQIINIVDKYFSDASLSCIREEYKKQGSFIIKILKEDTKHVLPRILKNLESKKEELEKAKDKLNQSWCEVHQQKKNSLLMAS